MLRLLFGPGNQEMSPRIGGNVRMEGFGSSDGSYVVNGVVQYWTGAVDVILRRSEHEGT